MKNFKAIIIAGFFAALAGVGFGVSAVHAATGDCTINVADIQAIKDIQNDRTLSYNDEIQKELAARKQLVSKTINCAKADAQALRDILNKSAVPDNMTQTQSQLSDRLGDAMNFYDLELGKLNDAGIAGSESVAKDVLTWRQGTYAPLAGTVSNLILWSQNQVLFRTAQSRMNQTQRAVSFIESAAGNDDLQKAFAGATAAFQSAEQANTTAQNLITQLASPDQSGAAIKQSLQALSDTYQKLFDVSTLITTLLPQSQ
jgi:hypothetical protein